MNDQRKFTNRLPDSCNKFSCSDSSGSKIMNLSSESEKFYTYNIFKLISAICNACVCTICKYLSRRSVPTLVYPCNCTPCNCEKCTKFAKNYDSSSIEQRIICENKSHDDLILNHLKCKKYICKVSPCNYSNCHAESIINDGENSSTITFFGDVGQSDSSQYSPCSCANCIQHCLSLPHSLVNQTRAIKPGIKMLNSLHKSCLSNSCSLRCVSGGDMVGKPTEEYHNFYTAIVENHQLMPQNVDFTDAAVAVCKCSFCECSSCPYREQASVVGSQESCKTISLLKKYVEDEWKRKFTERTTQDYKENKYDYGLHVGGPKRTISKVGVMRSAGNCSRCISDADEHARPCHCSIKEMLNNLYQREIEIEERDKLLNEQLYKNNYLCAAANVETNTEFITTDKSTDTDNQRCVENKVKNYEYTLKIDITAPNLDNISSHSTKRKIKKISKNKIKEQTQKVMNDIINDISRNSQMDQTNDTSFTDLKSHNCHKMDDFIVGCLTPIHNAITAISLSTGKVAEVSESELPSKDGSFLFQNEIFSPTSPEEISNNASIIESEMGSYLDELRVQEPCARRVSHHTVSLKWKLPKAIEGIMGYEILVDGKSIETIVNPRRCMAVISCLPPVQRLLITIRTITKTAGLGFLPCTTIGYHPRENKYIYV